jgi:outer membrane protein
MPQNRKMKRIGTCSVLFAAVAAALAQSQGEFTPVPPPSRPPAQTRATAPAAAPASRPTPPAVAGTNAPAERTMSLTDCIQAALAHNFDVQVQRINPQISLYNLSAAYSGYDPIFSVSGTHNYSVSPGTYSSIINAVSPSTVSDRNSFNAGLSRTLLPWTGLQYSLNSSLSETYGNGFDNSSGNVGVSLSQPLLKNFRIDSTRLNIRVAKNRLKYSEQGLRQQIITSVTAVANAYYELIYAQQNVQVQQEALDLSQTQLDQDKQRVQIGTLAILSVQQDESQAAQNKANLIAAQSTLDTAQNTLKNLLTDHYTHWHGTDIQPTETLMAPPQTFNLQESWTKGMAERPDLLQAKLNVEQQGIQLKYDRNQLLPDLELTGSYGYSGSGREFDSALDQTGHGNSPNYSYGATLSMPLGNVSARNQYKIAKATLQQIGLQFKQLEQSILVEIDNAVKQAQSGYESVQATKQARIYAQAALDAEQKTYAVGKATTFEVLQYQNNLTAARGQEIRSLANYEEALANLAAQEGTTLERYNINLEAE